MNYKAIVKDGKSLIIIETESNSKKQFICDLRDNGYKVCEYKVKKSDVFDFIMDNTNCEVWDWKENN